MLKEKIIQQKREKALSMIGKTFYRTSNVQIKSIDEKNYDVTFIMTSSFEDRHGDIVDQKTLQVDRFLQNPVFPAFHNTSTFPLGQWKSLELEIDPENPLEMRWVGVANFAVELNVEEITRGWGHVKRGDIRAVSIGFIPKRVEYDEEKDVFILYDCELLECSLVLVPSNYKALVKEVEEEKISIKENLIEVKKNLEKTMEETPDDRKAKARKLINKAIRQFNK